MTHIRERNLPISTLLDRPEDAYRWLEKAIEQKESLVPHYATDPALESTIPSRASGTLQKNQPPDVCRRVVQIPR